MSNKECQKLVKASDDAVGKNVQHILVIVKSDRSITINGSNNTVQAVLQNANLYASLQDTIANSRVEEGERLEPIKVYSYSPLPVSPYSPEWKGSGMIRKVLDDMVTTAGYGKYGRKLGQGLAPLGWPVDSVPWEGYAGAGRPYTNTNRCLTNQQLTQIIIGMLQAAHLDPATHVMHVHAQPVHAQPVNAQPVQVQPLHAPRVAAQPDHAVNNNAVGNDNGMENLVDNDEGMDIVEERVELDEANDHAEVSDDGENLSEDDTDIDDTETENNSDVIIVESEVALGSPDHNYNITVPADNSNDTEVETRNNLKSVIVFANDLSELEEVV